MSLAQLKAPRSAGSLGTLLASSVLPPTPYSTIERGRLNEGHRRAFSSSPTARARLRQIVRRLSRESLCPSAGHRGEGGERNYTAIVGVMRGYAAAGAEVDNFVPDSGSYSRPSAHSSIEREIESQRVNGEEGEYRGWTEEDCNLEAECQSPPGGEE